MLDSILSGELTPETSDEDLMSTLTTFADTCISYAQ